MGKVLVIAEHYRGRLNKGSLASIAFARQFEEFDIAVLGFQTDKIVEDLKAFGAKKIYQVDQPLLANYMASEYTAVVAELVKKQDVEYIAMTTSTMSKDLLPAVAACLGAGMVSDVMAIDNGVLKHPIYAGNVIANVKINTPQKVVTILGTAFDEAQPIVDESPVEKIDLEITKGNVRWISIDEKLSDRPELTDADIIVAGGRGIKCFDNVKMLEQLADKLNAAVGWSRAAVDAGWAPNNLQVGQTGKTVAPEVYFACGISGAIQHVAGMKDSKVVVAINRDAEAPIFSIADYGLVADLFQVLPELIDKCSILTCDGQTRVKLEKRSGIHQK